MAPTTLASPWAPPPSIICDFGWYSAADASIFGTLRYEIGGTTYPPSGARFLDYITILDEPVTFDVFDSLSLGIPVTQIPNGISVVEFHWDLGNGVTGDGPLIATTYLAASPDAAATLTIVDSLGRRYTTTHRLNIQQASPGARAGGKFRVPAGGGRLPT